MGESEYIHLATHGEPDGVLLSGAPKAEGKLSMAAVQALRLATIALTVTGAVGLRSCRRDDKKI